MRLQDQSDAPSCSITIPDDWAGWVVTMKGQHKGRLIDQMTLIFEGTQRDWRVAPPRPWSRSLVELERGEHVAAMPVLKTKERSAKYYFAGPVGHVHAHFLKNNTAMENGLIVVVDDFKVLENLDHYLERFKGVVWAENSVRAWRVFRSGRAQFMLAPRRQSESLDMSLQDENIEKDVFPPLASPLFFMVAKRSPCAEDKGIIEENLGRLKLDIQ